MGNSTVRVLGRNVKITNNPDAGKYGSWDATAGIINVTPGADAFSNKDTLLHEIMHAILTQQGYNHAYKLEESFVRPLATGLISVFQDNPQLAKWLIAKVR